MVVGFSILGLICIIVVRYHEQRKKIKYIYLKLLNYILNNEQQWLDATSQIMQNKKWQCFNQTIDKKTDAYLIVMQDMEIKTYSLNSSKQKNITVSTYSKLIEKFKNKQSFYKFNLDTAYVYYLFDTPYENCILWLDYDSADMFKGIHQYFNKNS